MTSSSAKKTQPAGSIDLAELWFKTWMPPTTAGTADGDAESLFSLAEQPLQASEQWINGLLNVQAQLGHQYAESLHTENHDGPLDPLADQIDKAVDSWVDWRRQCWRFYFDSAGRMLKQTPFPLSEPTAEPAARNNKKR